MRVAFVVADLNLSGGINVVMHHATGMAARPGWSVAIVVAAAGDTKAWPYPALETLDVLTMAEAADDHFDVAIATWWGTVRSLPLVPADRYAYFVQSLEDRFPRRHEKTHVQLAGATYHLGLPAITEAAWIHDLLRSKTRAARSYLVRNGIDKDIFAPVDAAEPRVDGPLRVLIEGSRKVRFKGVDAALESAGRMTTDRHVTLVAIDDPSPHPYADKVEGPMPQAALAKIYAETDVFLKLSRVEGMFGPPLEAMHAAATCVVAPVTGHDMYVRHGWNGLLTSWDDPTGTGAQLDLLNRDRRLLHYLRVNALATARAWPSWEESTNRFALAVREIRASPPTIERESLAELVRHLWRWPSDNGELARHLADDLAPVAERLRALGDSRWLRTLDVLERPVRHFKPGLGSVRRRVADALECVEETAAELREPRD